MSATAQTVILLLLEVRLYFMQMEELSSLFRMRLFREQQDDCYFGDDVELPLYMTEIDE
jgi:hypothetical protein